MTPEWHSRFVYAFDPVPTDGWYQTRTQGVLLSIKPHASGGWIGRIPTTIDAPAKERLALPIPAELPPDSSAPDLEFSEGSLWIWMLSPAWSAQVAAIWFEAAAIHLKNFGWHRAEQCTLCDAGGLCQVVPGHSGEYLLLCPACFDRAQKTRDEQQALFDQKLLSPRKACVLVGLTCAIIWASLTALLDLRLEHHPVEIQLVWFPNTAVALLVFGAMAIFFLVLSGIPSLWLRRTLIKRHTKLKWWLTGSYIAGLFLGEHLRHEILATRHIGLLHSPLAVLRYFFQFVGQSLNPFGVMLELLIAIAGTGIFYAVAHYFFCSTGSRQISIGTALHLPPPPKARETKQYIVAGAPIEAAQPVQNG